MKHFAGLDVSLEETTVCVVDEAGGIVREARVPSEPEALVAFFRGLGLRWSGSAWRRARWPPGCTRA